MHRRLCLAVGLIALLAPTRSHAYEFEVRARTIGQGYQLRSFRILTDNLLLRRSRFTQTLSLNIWDIMGAQKGMRLYDPRPPSGPKVYFTTYMRVDHDFGDWTAGDIAVGARNVDAVELIPELEVSSLGLDVLFAYAAIEGLADGLVDVRIGRQLFVESLDWFSMDGVTAAVNTPYHFTVVGLGGLRVRDSSPLGSAVQEPDGTASSECREYIEGVGWRQLDRPPGVGDDNPFETDFDLCPQRDEIMPTFGAAIETSGLPVFGRISYRRTVSKTVGLIDDPDRQDPPDVGYYPNENSEAPGWGVNEERIAATARAPLSLADGQGQVTPYVGARYSLLHGVIDEANAGARLRWGQHSIEPELSYFFPTFDGDSIFNVFSIEPYTDLRLTYDLRPMDRWRTYARGWVRRFSSEDAANNGFDATELSVGGQVGATYSRDRDSQGRVDGFYEDGYGGKRTGGIGAVGWRLLPKLQVASRVSVIYFDEDSLDDFDGTTFGAQAGATYVLHPGVALSVLAEENSNRFHQSQFRLIGVLDLAFNPDL